MTVERIYVVENPGFFILAVLIAGTGLAALFVGALMVGLTMRRRAGWALVAVGTALLGGSMVVGLVLSVLSIEPGAASLR
jgi:hypothetical protein